MFTSHLLIPNQFQSFLYHQFWLQNLLLICIFLSFVILLGFPTIIALGSKTKKVPLIWAPLIGFTVLSLFLQVATFLHQLDIGVGPFLPHILIPAIALYLFVLAIIIHRQRRFSLPIHPHTLDQIFFSGLILYFILFFIISSSWFDPRSNTFFTPGYDVNHDAIVITSSVKYLAHNLETVSNQATHHAHLISHKYPLGGTYLQLMFSQLTQQDVFFIYPRLILLAQLLILFPFLPYAANAFRHSRFGFLFALILSTLTIFNYLNIAILNTSVLGSTIMTLGLLGTVLLIASYLINNIGLKQFGFMLYLIISTTVYFYDYIIAVYLLIILICFRFFKLPRINTLIITTLLVIATVYTNPVIIKPTLDRIHTQLTASDPEQSLIGSKGNTAGFLNPMQSFSLWFSHPNYLQANSRVRNDWLGFAIALILIILASIKPKHLLSHSQVKLSLGLLCGFLALSLISIVLTRSSYQNSKIMHHLAIVWPFILVGLAGIYFKSRKNSLFVHGSILLFSLIMLASGWYTFRFVPTPLIDDSLELMQLEPIICSHHSPLLIINRNEWARYFLMSCHHYYNFFDRTNGNFTKIVSVTRFNELNSIIDPCRNSSLLLPEAIPSTYNHLLIDNCFIVNHPNLKLLNSWDHYSLYAR